MIVERVIGILIILEWKLFLYWFLIFEGNCYKSFVKFCYYLFDKKLIMYGKSNKLVFVKFLLKFKMLVLRI